MAVVGVHMHVMSFTFAQCPHEAKHSYGSLYSLWDRENPRHSGLLCDPMVSQATPFNLKIEGCGLRD